MITRPACLRKSLKWQISKFQISQLSVDYPFCINFTIPWEKNLFNMVVQAKGWPTCMFPLMIVQNKYARLSILGTRLFNRSWELNANDIPNLHLLMTIIRSPLDTISREKAQTCIHSRQARLKNKYASISLYEPPYTDCPLKKLFDGSMNIIGIPETVPRYALVGTHFSSWNEL